MINKLIKFLINLKWKREHFYVYSWGVDEHVSIHIMTEECYQDRHRNGVKEEFYKEADK